MSPSDHDDAVRRSFERQVGLFAGEGSPFARRPSSPLAWIEPLDTDMIVLDVALTYGETTDPIVLPVETIFTDVADRDAVLSALRSELDGGAATGLEPSSDGGQIVVSFTTTVVHAARA